MNAYNGFTPTQRYAALRWLQAEYAAGRRHKPKVCDACGQTQGALEAHSENYSGPPFGAHIGQFGLCYRCHMMIHCRFRNPAAWKIYRELIAAGGRFQPLYNRVFGVVTAWMAMPLATVDWYERPLRQLLDEIERGEHDPRLKRA